MMDKLNIKSAIFIIFSLVLIIPVLQSTFSVITVGKLEGAFIQKEKPVLKTYNWFAGKYQTQAEEYINENFGFRNILVRLNNQIAFSLFNKANADNIVVGKKNYLFQRPTINAYYGQDFMGRAQIERRMQQLKFISDTLSKLNKNLIIIFGTGKGSFFSEFIPEKLKTIKGSSNLEYHLELATQYGLNHIDFNSHFINMKEGSQYPLFPQYGIHWSRYGGYLVTDSIIHLIESLRKADLPDILVDSIRYGQPENEDYDIAGGMNLLFRLKSFEMAYPKIRYESDSGKTRPKLLVIGDSFYWGCQNMDISKAFSVSQFWFYNKRGTAGALKELSVETKYNMAKEITEYDVIMLLCTESNLPQLGWGFIESTFAFYKGMDIADQDKSTFLDDVEFVKERIKNNPRRMELIIEMARMEGISIDSMITRQAIIRVTKRRNNN